ncbi:coiled-coil domain-containing protein 144A-like [Strix aluco]|uniref:coiled-coil domain-containing protein 144A-like n=1 Tax=Strix aluco TaxID=111821 RepID=UPI003DA5C4C6
MAEMREENKSLSRQLSKAERKADGLEKEVEQLKNALLEKTSALDQTERELQESKRQTLHWCGLSLEWYGVCLLKEQKTEDAIKKAEELQHQLAQLQSENFLLRQQLGDAQNNNLPEQMRTEAQLQGELADAVRKQHTAETALNASTHQCNRLKAENSRLQEDLDKAKAKACELSAQLELQSQKSLQLEALNKEMGQTVTSLSARLATPGAGHTTTAPEEKQYLSLRLEVQAAAEARVEEINTAVASWRNDLEQILERRLSSWREQRTSRS